MSNLGTQNHGPLPASTTATFLFWNLCGKSLCNLVAQLAASHSADFVILAECPAEPQEIEAALTAATQRSYYLCSNLTRKTLLFTWLPRRLVVDQFSDERGRLVIRKLQIGPFPGVILAVVHLPDRRNWTPEGQALNATFVASDIRRIEDRLGHQRTILVGDLNMNPFDSGVVSPLTLNAVPTRELAERGDRIVQGKAFHFFYNPMWSFFGDRTRGPAGTFFLPSPEVTEHYWNIVDQVLVRPPLVRQLIDVQIVPNVSEVSLLDAAGRPNTEVGSDHLPLCFRLNFKGK